MRNKPCRSCGGTGRENDHIKIGKKLRKERLSKGISAKFVAISMGISPQLLSDLEKGRRCWTVLKIGGFKKAIA